MILALCTEKLHQPGNTRNSACYHFCNQSRRAFHGSGEERFVEKKKKRFIFPNLQKLSYTLLLKCEPKVINRCLEKGKKRNHLQCFLFGPNDMDTFT